MRIPKLTTPLVNIVFSNGPAEDESVTGLKTVSFSLTGTGPSIQSLKSQKLVALIPHSGNLTGTPWLLISIQLTNKRHLYP